MTTTDTIGAQLRQPDPRGWLVFEHLPEHVQRAEDSTADCDVTMHRENHRLRGPVFTRPATETERLLLDHLGYSLPPNLRTRVEFVTDNVRNRRWPPIERTIQP